MEVVCEAVCKGRIKHRKAKAVKNKMRIFAFCELELVLRAAGELQSPIFATLSSGDGGILNYSNMLDLI